MPPTFAVLQEDDTLQHLAPIPEMAPLLSRLDPDFEDYVCEVCGDPLTDLSVENTTCGSTCEAELRRQEVARG
jgi:hypothetical protein